MCCFATTDSTSIKKYKDDLLNQNEIMKRLNVLDFSYGMDKCFVCGCNLIDNTNDCDNKKTEEHIIPRWVQRRYNLWTKPMRLSNGTKMQYQHLKVQCCHRCNEKMKKYFEDFICDSSLVGFENLKRIDDNKLFLWATKISYGLAYRELFLLKDRANPKEGMICSAYDMDERIMERVFLEAVVFENDIAPKLGSVFTFDLIDAKEEDFFVSDLHSKRFFYIQLGKIGIAVCTFDSGLVKKSIFQSHCLMRHITKDEFYSFTEICSNIVDTVFAPYYNPLYIVNIHDGFWEEDKTFSIEKIAFGNEEVIVDKLDSLFVDASNICCCALHKK